MYAIVKQIHLILVVSSVCLFQFRYWRHQIQRQDLQSWAKISPHVIDTLLLISGVSLAVMAGFNPANSPWLMAKLMALLVYIAFGLMAMKNSGTIQWTGYLVATCAVIYMAVLALYKELWPL